MDDGVFNQFLAKFKEGKTDSEVAAMLTEFVQFESAALYEAMVQILTEQDFAELEKIEDESKIEEAMIKRFSERAGITPQEFVNKLRDRLSEEYLKKNPQA